MSRQNKRLLFSGMLFLGGGLLVLFRVGWVIGSLPLLGYILLGLGLLGLLDVNIFWGGPFDKRLDAETNPLSPEAQVELERRVHEQGDMLHRFTFWTKVIPVIVAGILVLLALLRVI